MDLDTVKAGFDGGLNKKLRDSLYLLNCHRITWNIWFRAVVISKERMVAG
jgi:hypothetical protein